MSHKSCHSLSLLNSQNDFALTIVYVRRSLFSIFKNLQSKKIDLAASFSKDAKSLQNSLHICLSQDEHPAAEKVWRPMNEDFVSRI